VPVVPFSLLVDIVFKVHVKLAHIGRNKLISVVGRQYFHPSLSRVAADICSSCVHCQLYKVSSQLKTPPTIKIKSLFPFDLVAMDLLQFPKSSAGHVAALVVVDHFSKFLFAIPLRDKKSSSVCKAVCDSILPHILRLPSRVLTDNGPEFRSKEFNDALAMYNISHVYSTRYRASGNGAVERSNRTITEFLKGIVNENVRSWHVALNKAVVVYNNTWHVQINDTPSNFILHKAHNTDVTIPLDSATVDTWKDAHPQFKSFSCGIKVAVKVIRIGNQLSYKLGRKFNGPYTISKVQSNGVTYEVTDDSGDFESAS
jgi:transposase InsO family protein